MKLVMINPTFLRSEDAWVKGWGKGVAPKGLLPYPPLPLTQSSAGGVELHLESATIGAMTDTELAYIAGIIDGEGYLSGRNRIFLRVNMIDKPVIEWLCKTVGGRVELRHNGKWRDQWAWYLPRKHGLIDFLREVLPYLRVKHEQAQAIITYHDNPTTINRDALRVMNERNA